jgi:hypothetical protein
VFLVVMSECWTLHWAVEVVNWAFPMELVFWNRRDGPFVVFLVPVVAVVVDKPTHLLFCSGMSSSFPNVSADDRWAHGVIPNSNECVVVVRHH